MLTDRSRLFRRAAQPRLARLARALGRLQSTVTMMNTGAHPDDEQTGLLAWFSAGRGMRVVVACSTRGEGGQNALGPERGAALGLVRSREMEEAARAIDADVAWLGHGPVDPVHDFGFSKDGKDTLERWGRQRVIDRLVRAYREYRPDIVIPTFLDVPGQHGHHRAMTEAAEAALALAADPAYEMDGLAPWQVAKFYLPAWSGGGETYDDELPPPATTVMVHAPGTDPVTGMRYDQLGEVSRGYHASQGMGHWRALPRVQWPLHGAAPEDDVLDNLPATLAQLAAVAGAPDTLQTAAAQIDAARAAFPHEGPMIAALAAAHAALSVPLAPDFAAAHGHRITRKIAEVEAALALAAGVDATAWLQDPLVPGRSATLAVWVNPGAATVQGVGAEGIPQRGGAVEADGLHLITLAVPADQSPSSRYLPGWTRMGGNGILSASINLRVDSIAFTLPLDLEEEPLLQPAYSVTPSADAVLINLAQPQPVSFAVTGNAPDGGVAFGQIDGLNVAAADGKVTLTPGALGAGKLRLPISVAGQPGWQAKPISYAHIGRLTQVTPAGVDILALDLKMPEGRVGYVGGGADRVGLWLQRMGADVVDLDVAAFDLARANGFAGFDTIVVGIFTFGLRPDLADATADLREWVQAGGNLVTLYHRPWDNWKPDETTPARMVVDSPSLRWRVTRPNAPVTILEPDHDLLAGPNPITHADFDGWDKERGLYFLSSWDDVYQPLLAMSDPDEQPLLGSLVTGRVGEGRHTHCALVLHHQMDRLVPGAFRLMANLIQPA
ncbi:LmbE family protein [Ketogulonicigenium robustum]|uniref:LmbE family protein n=1 Tax=Ketogulonicigenium robustum TaxID=92947 RepID=A0A1W6P0R8_9RHOB|nr:PIG-L family deacetylase [Ketogulonicigenium robustum]ARO15034.1 LmbE family protein [Ketogulonicigenium robustum]